MEIELKFHDYNILVDLEDKKDIIQTANGLINDLELYNQKEVDNYSIKYAYTRTALNQLFEYMLQDK